MADINLNPEKTGLTTKVEEASFSPAHSEGYASGALIQVAEATRKLLPQLVICPDGNVAGMAYDKSGVAKLNQECRDKG
jgi:hypothetical protein